MANTKEIQSRINSIHDTMKITKAMYMMSSVKLKERKQTFLYLKGMFLLYNHVYNYFLLFNCINFTVILMPIYQA